MRDIVLSNDLPSALLLQKHIDFLASYGTDKNDYVSIGIFETLIYITHCASQSSVRGLETLCTEAF